MKQNRRNDAPVHKKPVMRSFVNRIVFALIAVLGVFGSIIGFSGANSVFGGVMLLMLLVALVADEIFCLIVVIANGD